MITQLTFLVAQLLFWRTEGRVCVVDTTKVNLQILKCNCSNHLELEDAVNQSINNTALDFCDEVNHISGMVSFQKRSNLSLQGYHKFGTVLYCPLGEESGLKFTEIENLTIVKLKFVGCGAVHNSTTLDTISENSSLTFLTSVYILNCKHVTVMEVSVVDSNGTGTAIFDANGHINLDNSTFRRNYVRKWNKNNIPGGGGVYIEFTYCPPGNIKQIDCYNNSQRNQDSIYHIYNCTFDGNI